jgi:hypothetical protein
MGFSAAQRVLRARLGGLQTAANGTVNTGPARSKFLSRFDDEVDPARVLSSDERARRAEAARKVYFARLALKSSVARAKKKEARRAAHVKTSF